MLHWLKIRKPGNCLRLQLPLLSCILSMCLLCLFVTSGQVYKLQTPNARYLASLSTYDSSNPTKDWGFPELSVDSHSLPFSKSSGNHVSKTADGVSTSKDLSTLPDNLSASGQRIHV